MRATATWQTIPKLLRHFHTAVVVSIHSVLQVLVHRSLAEAQSVAHRSHDAASRRVHQASVQLCERAFADDDIIVHNE